MSSGKSNHIAYRCPDCGEMVFGLVGEFAMSAGLLRLKCNCTKSALDIQPTADKKIKLSVPCVLCKENHNFIVSSSMLLDRDILLMNCPYANVDIAFIGEKEKIDEAASANEATLNKLVSDMGVEHLDDLQPIDVDDEDVLPDASVYDLIRFVVKDLEADGALDCPCRGGNYDLRYCPGGIQVYCVDCGAVYEFKCASASAAEEYLNLSEIKLS